MDTFERQPRREPSSRQMGYQPPEKKKRNFIRRSTIINFFAILLIIGAVIALRATGKHFVLSDKQGVEVQKTETKTEAKTEAKTESTIETKTETKAEPNTEAKIEVQIEARENPPQTTNMQAMETMADSKVVLAPAVDGEPEEAKVAETANLNQKNSSETQTAPQTVPQTAQATATPKKQTVSNKKKSAPAKTRSVATAVDHDYSVENLDNEQARRKYLETNKTKASKPVETAPATYSTYTMPETLPEKSLSNYAKDDLDGAAAREQYRKKNQELSSAKLK